MLSLRVHNILDYVAGVFLLMVPYVFGFAEVAAARNAFLFIGLGVLVYSLLTNYYYAFIRYLPLGVHMSLDVIVGVFLMVAPWSLNYRESISPTVEYLHYVIGIMVFALVAMTREKTEEDKREHGIRVAPVTTGRGI